jgi:hypothetical protein
VDGINNAVSATETLCAPSIQSAQRRLHRLMTDDVLADVLSD